MRLIDLVSKAIDSAYLPKEPISNRALELSVKLVELANQEIDHYYIPLKETLEGKRQLEEDEVRRRVEGVIRCILREHRKFSDFEEQTQREIFKILSELIPFTERGEDREIAISYLSSVYGGLRKKEVEKSFEEIKKLESLSLDEEFIESFRHSLIFSDVEDIVSHRYQVVALCQRLLETFQDMGIESQIPYRDFRHFKQQIKSSENGARFLLKRDIIQLLSENSTENVIPLLAYVGTEYFKEIKEKLEAVEFKEKALQEMFKDLNPLDGGERLEQLTENLSISTRLVFASSLREVLSNFVVGVLVEVAKANISAEKAQAVLQEVIPLMPYLPYDLRKSLKENFYPDFKKYVRGKKVEELIEDLTGTLAEFGIKHDFEEVKSAFKYYHKLAEVKMALKLVELFEDIKYDYSSLSKGALKEIVDKVKPLMYYVDERLRKDVEEEIANCEEKLQKRNKNARDR